MFKKTLCFGSMLLAVIALLALSGCELGINGGKEEKSPPDEVEDPSLRGDLGGIALGLLPPVHDTPARTVVNGTNAAVQFFWEWNTEGGENGPGVKEGKFWYNGGKAAKARALVTARSGYVFSQTFKKADVLDAFSAVITGNIDTYTLSDDNTELDFTFFYTVDRAALDLTPLKDIGLVAGSNMPDFIEGTTLAHLDPDSPPVNEYVYADNESPLFFLSADEPFKVKVKAAAAYGYKWPDAFDYAGVYKSAAKVTPLVNGSVLSLTLEYAGALQPIDFIPQSAIQPLFTVSSLEGGTIVPGKLILGTGADAPNFTAEELKWTGLTEDGKIFAGMAISTPVKLIPKKGYTFTESALKDEDIAEAINAINFYNQKVEDVKKDHTLEFTLIYPVPAVRIAGDDLALNMISNNFYQPRIGQPVYKNLAAHQEAKFTVESIFWFDQPGNVLTSYTNDNIHASITLKAKPGYTFAGINTTALAESLPGSFTKNNIAKDKGPVAAFTGTPDETLIFTLTYAKTNLSPQISISGGTVTATADALNAGGGLAEMFTLRDKVTISGGGTLDGPVIIPVRKTLALGAGSQVTADAKGLESGGTIIIGNNGSFTVNGLSDITGDITFEGSGKLTLTGETKENVNNKIGNSTSKSIQIKGPASGSAEIILDGKAVLDFTGNVTATNVTINSSGKCSQINIPADKTLTIGSGASLVLNSNKDKSAAGDTGELKGIVTVKSGGAIIDENTNRGAWKVAEGGSIVIEYGGVGIIKIKDSDTTGTVLVGTKDEKTKSEYIQLVANRAKFTNKADEYLLTGPIVLAKTFSTLWKVVVEESFTIKTDATLDIGDNMIVGTGTGSKLVIEKDATVKGKHSIISGNNIGSSCFSAGTYDWVPVNGDTKAHWKLQQDES